MAQLVTKKTNLGPGFLPFNIFLAVISLMGTIVVLGVDLDKLLPEAASPAVEIDGLFKFLTIVAGWIFVYVAGYLVYFTLVFEKPDGAPDNAIGVQIHDAPKLELWWTIIPTILVIILAIYSVVIWRGLQTQAGNVLTVEAIGHQFNFEFRYPGMQKSVYNDFHVPLNTPVTVHTTSADVIHGFWLPEVRLKADMVPGLVNTLRFTPRETGTFRIICTEFCGAAHGAMVAQMTIDSPDAFKTWMAQQNGQKVAAASAGSLDLSAGSASDGQATFNQKCTACHSTGAFTDKKVGPGLGKVLADPAHPKLVNGSPATPAGVAGILQKGYLGDMGQMPNQQANAISDKDIANLVAYIASMSKK